jgi:hypothetical protein
MSLFKKCIGVCGLEKELNLNNFYKRSTARDGFTSQCKNCYHKGHILIENDIKYQICIGKCGLKLELNIENFGWEDKHILLHKRTCRKCISEINKIKTAKNKKPPKEKIIKTTRLCCGPCGLEKELNNNNFHFKNKSKGIYQSLCKDCGELYFIDYKKKNRDKILETKKIYRENNKEKISIYNKEYNEKKKEEKAKTPKIYKEPKKKNVIRAKIHKKVSSSILKKLKSKNKKKNGSIVDYLEYSMQDLQEHIEKQFLEPGNEWMNWDNWGIYNPKIWDDNDKSTWKWQLDHIIPHAEFEYESMDSDEFRECWKLSNLRPYGAKPNVIDGARRTRHKKKDK